MLTKDEWKAKYIKRMVDAGLSGGESISPIIPENPAVRVSDPLW